MKSNTRQIALIALGILGLAVGFQNCAKTSFNQDAAVVSSLIGSFGQVAQPPPEQTVCGAFDAGGQSSANCDVAHAFVGNLFVEPRADLVQRSHGGYMVPAGLDASIAGVSQPAWLSGSTTNGVFTPYTIVATSFDTIGNPFASGFTTQTGEVVTIPDANGGTANVAAWFAIRMDGLFHLANGDTPGAKYQFAVIADDGAQIQVQIPGQGLTTIVDDQTPQSVKNPGGYIPGTQYVRMGCSQTFNDPLTIQTFTLAAKQTLPMRLTYYQGPIGLSLRLMYREVPAAGADDLYCETDVNKVGAKTKSTVVKASPALDTKDLAAHGWKVITSSNLGSL